MAWIAHRNAVIAVALIIAAFLLNFGASFGMGINDVLLNTGFKISQVVAAGAAYIAFAIYNRYV